ncbi:hypothetical protein X768_07315 [Mesorhizobium sp. LSJC265A00]|nr:hypothetical protein X770_09250 [Mesorhizobium sp. LSJC269B00]ESX12567.1 hypothetical protein X768_07315 [Mesorhizobium sp. LSJC265A00]ESX95391.1 hypothetical protein X754_07000 [Mesorhizobium sp. LNJC403B00]ESZ05381.1 hypothetical protein X736_18065 [Mesorhizobium sp. L2C089B000]ESZ61447.1 hypothetical protein X728_12965 [Mesorhizobium sp. L103C120A0]
MTSSISGTRLLPPSTTKTGIVIRKRSAETKKRGVIA